MLANGKYPLGITKLEPKERNESYTNTRKAVNNLIKFEIKLRHQNMKRKRSKFFKETSEDFDETPKSKRQKILNNEKGNILLSQKKSKEIMIQKKKKNNKAKVNNLFIQIQGSDKDKNTKKHSCTKTVEHKSSEDEENTSKKEQKVNEILNTNNANKIKRRFKKKHYPKSAIGDVECIFKRNSGTWFVIDVSKNLEESSLPNKIGR